MRDWPGADGPLIHVPDPIRDSGLIVEIAPRLAPTYRVLSIAPRPECAYQIHVADLEGVLAQFGFEHTLIAAEGLACVSALLLAAWFPERVAALVLIDASLIAPDGETLLARSMRDCPPQRPALHCPLVELSGTDPTLVGQLERLLAERPVP